MLINNQDELENLTDFIINTGIPAIEKLLGVLSSAASGAAVIGDVLGQLRGDTDIRTPRAGAVDGHFAGIGR